MSILTAILRFSEKVTLGVVELDVRRRADRADAGVLMHCVWQNVLGPRADGE